MVNRITVPYRRKREGKTNYKKRIELLKSKCPRLIIRITSKYITAQFVEFFPKGDKVIVSATSKELQKLGWGFECKNMPSAYLLGALIAKKAKEKGVKDAIVDTGRQRSIPKSRMYAVVKGVLDSGINVPCSKEVLPDENRISGKHIADYAGKSESNFTGYKKKNLDPKQIPNIFNDFKKKIAG